MMMGVSGRRKKGHLRDYHEHVCDRQCCEREGLKSHWVLDIFKSQNQQDLLTYSLCLRGRNESKVTPKVKKIWIPNATFHLLYELCKMSMLLFLL